MKSSEIREKFLAYFEAQKHTGVASASLIPIGDDTLFFTNAGMVPFKNIFTGKEKAKFKRATSSQKCLRVSGKHNDLENVGRTARHHTFFEMLGNFSFGDYFKKDAIRYAWEFLTVTMKLPKEKLWVSIYTDDDEAESLWLSETDIPKDRILRFGEKENFWSMGETGPCGPCSEIHYDHGAGYGCGSKNCGVNCDAPDGCDRFMEIWNLVFMQFERDESGKMSPLPKPSIDTGMGLERLACVVQGKHSNYESDLFTPLIRAVEALTHQTYGRNPETDVSMHVLADHIRAATFLISDGVQPSNEGRGYVLRRILRRAIRHGKLLGMKEPFFYKLVATVINEMGPAYPQIKSSQKSIERIIKGEEERFLQTLERGLAMIEDELKILKGGQEKMIRGELVFQLYDTYGFPADLTELIASEHGFHADMAGFEAQMQKQKERGKKAWKGSGAKGSSEVYHEILKKAESRFIGYDNLQARSQVISLLKEEKVLARAETNDTVEIVTKETPFYPEGGGQVGDQGLIFTDKIKITIQDTRKPVDGLIVHRGRIVEGTLHEGEMVSLAVDPLIRQGAAIHHSATHLLHQALRRVLGEHVRQGGSLVTPHRLRFDFTHGQQVTKTELQQIEDLANEAIRRNLQVLHEILPYDEAIAKGALAFFGDKYGARVRTCQMGDFSFELCAGTHVKATGEIGLLKVVGESSVSAGTRRIEAVVGPEALNYLRQIEASLQQAGHILKASPNEISERLIKMLSQVKTLEKELEKFKREQAGSASGVDEKTETIKGVTVKMLQATSADPQVLRPLSDQAIQKLGSGIVLLAGISEGMVSLIIRVSKDLEKYHAGNLIKALSPLIGGSGGGRADMAQAGGTKVEGVGLLFESLKKLV